MNDDVRLERHLADGLHDLAPVRAPDRLRTQIKAETGEARQRARWLAFIKEPPMRTNSRLAVGSPTARVVAIVAATLLTALLIVSAGIAGARLLAADDPIVVDQSGGGDYTTISQALDAAVDGDEIIVKPGTYAEAITIDKDIVLRGDGPVAEVRIEHPDAVLVTLQDSTATLADLTLGGGEMTRGMEVYGGAPTISAVVFDHTGRPFDGEPCMGTRDLCGGSSLMLIETDAQVIGGTFHGGGEIMIDGGGDVLFEGNLVEDGPQFFIPAAGDGTIFRGNTIRNTIDRSIGIFGPTAMTVEGNTIEGAGGDAITIGFETATGHDPTIRDNQISGSAVALRVGIGAAPVVEGNHFSANGVAVESNTDAAAYRGNTLEGNDVGLAIIGSPVLDGNTVSGAEVGLRLSGPQTTPTLTGNVVCDNQQNLVLAGRAELPADDGSNQICGEPVTA